MSLCNVLNIKSDNNQFIIIGKNGCPYTQRAQALLLNQKNKVLYFDYHNTLTSEQKTAVDLKCGAHRTFPRVFYNEKLIGGYDDLVKSSLYK